MQESISCISGTESWQVHWVQCRERFSFLQPTFNAKRLRDCKGRSLHGPQGGKKKTTPKSKKQNQRFLSLPAQTVQQSQRHHSCPSKPIILAALEARDFGGLPASDRILSWVDWLGAGAGTAAPAART